MIVVALLAVDAVVGAAALVVLKVVLYTRSSRSAWNASHGAPDPAAAQAQAQQSVANYHAAVADFRVCLAVFAGAVVVLAVLAALAGRRRSGGSAARVQWAVTALALTVFSGVALANRPVPAQVAVPTPVKHSTQYCSGGSCPPGLGG